MSARAGLATRVGALEVASRPIRVLLAGHSHAADGGASYPDFGGFHKLVSHLLSARLESLAWGGAVLAMPENITMGGGVRTGGYARFLNFATVARSAAPYVAGQQLTVLDWGANDMAFMGPNGGVFDSAFKHAFRAVISRARASAVKENTDASCTYPVGVWTPAVSAQVASGGGYTFSPTAGAQVSIAVPADFPGGTIALGFITGATGDGAAVNIAVSGATTQATTFDTRNINGFDHLGTRAANGKIVGSVKRLTGLNAGAHTITITSTATQGNFFFDYWQMEAITPGLVAVVLHPRFVDYSIYGAVWPYGSAQGYSDTDIATVNAAQQAIVDEFADSASVFTIAQDDLFNKSATLFAADKAHLNDLGHGLLAQRLVTQVKAKATLARLTVPTVSDKRFWTDVTFQNSWVNYGSPLPACQFRKDWVSGLVEVKGAAKNGTAATATMFTLPAGYRPLEHRDFGAAANTTVVPAVVRVGSDGAVTMVASGSTLLNEFSVMFAAEQ